MPLKINLALDLQLVELEKARDPMKFIVAGVAAVAALGLVWAGWAFTKGQSADSLRGQYESDWKKLEGELAKRTEQQAMQAKVADRASSLDKAVNHRILKAEFFDQFRKTIPPEVELRTLKVTRINQEELNVIFEATWVGQDAAKKIGEEFVRLKAGEVKMEGYEILGNTVQSIPGSLENPTKVDFTVSYKVKALAL